MSSMALTARDFAGLLDALGVGEHERISVCHQVPGKKFSATIPRNRTDAVGVAASPLPKADRWFGINTLDVPDGYQGRGRTSTSPVRWPCSTTST